jgi:putative ABC transport system permease protein
LLGAIAGIYPSFYLSAVNPVKAVKGDLKQSGKMSGVYRGLVVFQFAASIMLIIGSGMVLRQMNYIINKDLGFKKEQVVLLKGTNTLEDKIHTFKNELLKLPKVENVTISNYLPIEGTMRNGNTYWNEGKRDTEEPVGAQNWLVDNDYIETMGMKIIDGRNFSKERSSDKNATIINREMAERLGLDEPVGKFLDHFGRIIEIVGVVEDFHYNNMKGEIWPLCLNLGNSTETMSIKINSSDISGTLHSIESKWAEFSPHQSMRYSFLDNEFAMMYNNVKRTSNILFGFAVLAIVIACMGLFALAQFSIKNRIKEIGIRKVNGAKLSELLSMLNRDFVIWVVVAFIIAAPIAYYGIDKWLENFAYKTTISWWLFAIAGAMALGIALLTISWQSWRAASRNPVEALRYE